MCNMYNLTVLINALRSLKHVRNVRCLGTFRILADVKSLFHGATELEVSPPEADIKAYVQA
jgi:hypothetical protein